MHLLRTISLLTCLAWPLAGHADVLVVVHPESPVAAMTPREVSDLYLGRSRSLGPAGWEGSVPAVVYEQPVDSALREKFFRSLNGMGLKALNAYWARLRFSGEVLPPMTLADSRAVVEAVGRNYGAIGYVDEATPVQNLRVVLRLKE